MAGIITTSSIPKALQEGVKAFFGDYNPNPLMYPDLVYMETSDKNYEELVQVNGFRRASIKEQGGSIVYDSNSQIGVARALHVVFGLGFIVTREEVEDNLYEKLAIMRSKSLKTSMIDTKETFIANFLNNGFDANYPGGADNMPLFSSAHPSSSGNQSNILSTPADISESAIEDLIIQIGMATDDKGLPIQLKPMSLCVPPSLVFEAIRILKSVGQYDTANNAINALRESGSLPGGIKSNVYFTDPDAWFIKTNALQGLTLFQRRELDFARDNDFSTENVLNKATERYSVQWGDWRHYYGSNGA